MSNESALIVSESELSLVENPTLNRGQLSFLLKKTPAKYLRQRPAKGGGTWTFVSGGYVKKCLNLMFGWDWDFEVLSEQVLFNQIVIKGRLTVRTAGKTIIKTQFGKKEIVYRKATTDPLDIGNDFKAAATDALKKCAAEIGIASDVYNKEEFREIQVVAEIDKESERVTNHIVNSKTIEQLNQVKDELRTDAQVELFADMKQKLTKK